jgi:hypothetical protein
MKRSAALAPLSRDRQHALDAALRLRAPSRSPSRRCSRISTGASSARGNGLSRSRSGWLLPALPAGDEEWGDQRLRRVRHTITSTLPNRTSLMYWLGVMWESIKAANRSRGKRSRC